MAITDKIHIDFQLFSTGDPKVLVIMDTSIWSYIEDKPSIIEITVPSSEKVITYSYLKNKTNVFNSSNLLLSPIGIYNDLPDGIYRITVKGSPSTLCKHRDVLKTDKTKLELFKLYWSLGTGIERKDSKNSATLKKIKEIKFLIESAEALVSTGEVYKGLKELKKAMTELKKYNECKDCE